MTGNFLKGVFGESKREKSAEQQIDKVQKQIDEVIDIIGKSVETQNILIERIDNIQKDILMLATNGAKHKQVIDFLLKNSSFDEDGAKDLIKMLKNMNSLDKKVIK